MTAMLEYPKAKKALELGPNWGPQGRTVYERTYRRVMADGSMETWLDTITRVVDGNLGLVETKFHELDERDKLIDLFYNFRALPAGRHLWMSGVPGRQFLFNCHVSGWREDVEDHYAFTFNQLMQGGGVGANYSNQYVMQYDKVKRHVDLHVVCDADHPDYEEIAPLLSNEYSSAWNGAVRVDDSREGWIDAMCLALRGSWTEDSTSTLVFDLSLIRHSGSRIKTFGGTAAGPAPLAQMLVDMNSLLNSAVGGQLSSLGHMALDHFIATCVVSGNVRRSARMSIKNWNDPDILDFINCKSDFNLHWSTNISVAIDNEFFRALNAGDKQATEVYAAVVAGMMNNGEPGFYNRSLAQEGEIGDVSSTNPCGEICLEDFENCNLGHVNLDSFPNDYQGAAEAHRLMTRFLVRATFGDVPVELQRQVVHRNRRIGVGHFGFQGWLVKQNVRFSDSHRNGYIRKTLRDFYDVVRKEARRYAFQLRIPEPIKVTTVAPTGTIAKLPGKTEGIHPIYSRYFKRRVRFGTVDPAQQAQLAEFVAQGLKVEDCIYTPLTKVVEFITLDSLVAEVEEMGLNTDFLVESADEIGFSDMLAVQAMYQE